jgi:hypothetical protein
VYSFFSPSAFYTPRPSHPRFDHPISVWWRSQFTSIFLSTPSNKSKLLCSSLDVRFQVSDPFETRQIYTRIFLSILIFMGLVTGRRKIEGTWLNIWQGRVYTSLHDGFGGPRVTSGKHLQNFNKQIYVLLARQCGYMIRGRSCLQWNISGYVMWFVVFTEVHINSVSGGGCSLTVRFCRQLVDQRFGGICCFHLQVFGDNHLPNHAVP